MTVDVHGVVAPEFEPVRDAFVDNFLSRGEVGAAVSVVHRGVSVVDLWAGHRDRAQTQPWESDTLVTVFSATKGMASTCLAIAHDRGWLRFDRPVAQYWPEFAANGKGDITVSQLLSHQGGLSALDVKLDLELINDKPRLAGYLASQKPSWPPGTRHAYHAFTLGFYQSELLRRVDPEGRGLGEFFRDEVAAPLGVSFYIGLPEDVPDTRIAPIQGFSLLKFMVTQVPKLPLRFVMGLAWPSSLVSRSLMNPKMSDPAEWDAPEYRRTEVASAAGLGTARALAAVYGDLAWEGQRLGVGRETRDLLAEPAGSPTEGPIDLIWGRETRFHLGWMKSCDLLNLPNPQCYGMMGASAADGFADPVARVGFGYTTNKMSLDSFKEPRRWALVDALYDCLNKD